MAGMEAAALSAAITGILKVVGNKLAPLVIKEYSSIVGVKKDLRELQDLVQEINCRLGTAGDRATGDAPWLKKLKQVASDVDDVVDEFQLKAEQHHANGGSGFVSRYLHTRTESFIFQYMAAKKIKKINKRFAKIVKQRTDLTAIFGHDPVSHINMSVVNMQTLPVGDEATIVGRDQEMHQIISNLVETNHKQEIKIVSIVGLGGSGKTALAKLIFNDGETIEKHFDVRLWVHVSQEFDSEKLIKKLFEAFADKDTGQPSLPYMSKRIQGGLTQKKFLIVMDDVWTESQNKWGEIMGYLKTGAPGSGLLLTTRSIKVAEAVRSTYKLCLPRLSQDDSWHLFQQSFRMPAKFLDSDFTLVAKEIIQTCCGLPLAIKVLAGSLADKELIGEWQAMRDILLDVEGEAVSACLNLSYLNLPSHLKQCFTMCSLFPKGHQIYKQQLIDQWIAHDMISLTPGVDDLEHIGHMYFNSLVQSFFLQDVEEYEGVVRCKMHDLFHDLARSILCEEISTIVQEDATSYAKGYRYFSLIEQPRKILPEEVFENARVIYVDKGDGIKFGKALKNTKHLRSIILNSVSSTAVLTSIFQVKNLKYLEMSQLKCEALPEAISDIWSMQALYIKSSSFLELPKSIGMLKKLRTLSLTGCSRLKSLPVSIGDCDMLSTLDFTDCIAFKELPSSIGRNKRLRVLRLVCTGIVRLPSSITTLENLEFLKLERNIPIELPEGIGNLTKIKGLELDKYIAIPSGIGQLTRLEKINSFCVEFDVKYARISELETLSRISGKLTINFLGRLMDSCDAHRACLKQKENLHELELSWGPRHRSFNEEHEVAVLDGLEPPLGIKQLIVRMYGGGQFAWWMLKQVGGGVQGSRQFPFLTKMILFDFPNLKQLDGLVQLPCLEKLHLKDMPALESISGGPFPSLVKLKMEGLCNLGEVWMVPDRTFFDKEEAEGCNNFNPHQSGQMQIGSHLTDLDIYCCPKLRVKPYFPDSLKHLQLDTCNINMMLYPCQGQGSFSSYSCSPPSYSHLKVVELLRMKSSLPLSPPWPPGLGSAGCGLEMLQHMLALESVVIFCCSDLTELPECLGELCSLQKMTIKMCNSLCSLPKSIGRLTSLQDLEIQECEALVQFPESLGELCSLRRLEIVCLPVLTCLPKSLCHLRSLKELSIGCCGVLGELPECLGELHCLHKFKIWGSDGLTHLPQSLCCLTSLQELEIGLCDAIGELPECLGELHCLRKFRIRELPSLTRLPQSLHRLTSSLEKFEIVSCPGIKSLPEWIKGLTALQRLEISGCPDLERRCDEEMGEDWHLVSHIPVLWIG